MEKLGKLQTEWLEAYNFMRQSYRWMGDPIVPDEEILAILIKCRVVVHNSTCFAEGTCVNARDPGCGYKKKTKEN